MQFDYSGRPAKGQLILEEIEREASRQAAIKTACVSCGIIAFFTVAALLVF